MNLNHMSTPGSHSDSESLRWRGARVIRVTRDPALTGYTCKLINEWLAVEADGVKRTQAELAELVGVAPSHVHQVLFSGLGVGGLTGKRYAAAFGKSWGQLVSEAEAWWAERGAKEHAIASVPAEDPWPHRRAGLEAARALLAPPATDAEIARVVAAYSADLFEENDTAWWVTTALGAVQKWRDREVRAKAETRLAQETAAAAGKDARRDRTTARELAQEKRAIAGSAKITRAPRRRKTG